MDKNKRVLKVYRAKKNEGYPSFWARLAAFFQVFGSSANRSMKDHPTEYWRKKK